MNSLIERLFPATNSTYLRLRHCEALRSNLAVQEVLMPRSTGGARAAKMVWRQIEIASSQTSRNDGFIKTGTVAGRVNSYSKQFIHSSVHAFGPAIAMFLATLALAACTTTGTGEGSTRKNDVHASFTWTTKGAYTGTLTASLDNGDTYSGTYFQITSETRVENLGPLWGGWHDSWRGWRYWDRTPTDGFITHYSGRVLANLDGPQGTHMRCHFQLIRPSAGMAGGGQGQCQLPSGKVIDTTFKRS